MPEYLAPGVYIEEIERGPTPIVGVSTSTAAFLGETERGPVWPRSVTSYPDFVRLYGDGHDDDRFLPDAIKGFFDNGGTRCFVARVVGAGAATGSADVGGFTVTARDPGAWSGRTWIRIGPGSTLGPSGDVVGFRLRVDHWDDESEVPNDAASVDTASTATISEDFDDLSLDPASTAHYGKVIGHAHASLITITAAPDAALPLDEHAARLTGGADGAASTVADFRGDAAEPDDRTGLAALELDEFREVAIVNAPAAGYDVARAVIEHCERGRFRFAVVDAQPNPADPTDIAPRDDVADSARAAFYSPWIYVADPDGGGRRLIPPGGPVCGIYARTDTTRGVFKAPANVTIAGAVDVEFDIDRGAQELLNPRGVNAIRRFPRRGIRVWGARTMSSDPLWRYVSVRRLLGFLEESILRSTRWAVFEPNNQRLWSHVERAVTGFLRSQWREGALLGTKEAEAFFVRVDRRTMTEDDIADGRLIIEIGVAPVRPAEFIVVRIAQKTKEASS